MAGGVGYNFLHLRQNDKLFCRRITVHGVSFTIIDVQTPCPEFELSIIGGNSPSLSVETDLRYDLRIGCCNGLLFYFIMSCVLLSSDRFICGRNNAQSLE